MNGLWRRFYFDYFPEFNLRLYENGTTKCMTSARGSAEGHPLHLCVLYS